MGKNYSRNNASGKRKESDFYRTHPSLVKQLLEVERFNCGSTILEPCCGDNDVVYTLHDYGFSKITAFDLKDGPENDFLKYKESSCYIITNPPYSQSLDFILHAKEVCTEKFAFLLPLTYLQGKQRLDMVYRDDRFPLAAVHVFCRYPMLGVDIRPDGKYPTGMQAYAWFVWNKWYPEDRALLKWIDNDPYVLRDKDLTEEERELKRKSRKRITDGS